MNLNSTKGVEKLKAEFKLSINKKSIYEFVRFEWIVQLKLWYFLNRNVAQSVCVHCDLPNSIIIHNKKKINKQYNMLNLKKKKNAY